MKREGFINFRRFCRCILQDSIDLIFTIPNLDEPLNSSDDVFDLVNVYVINHFEGEQKKEKKAENHLNLRRLLWSISISTVIL